MMHGVTNIKISLC